MTGGKAETSAAQRVNAAVVTALAPVCVEKFQRSADAGQNLETFKKTQSWSRGEFIEKGGWAKSSGAQAPEQVTAVASACAELLAA